MLEIITKYKYTKTLEDRLEDIFYFIDVQPNSINRHDLSGNFDNFQKVMNFVNKYFLKELEYLVQQNFINQDHFKLVAHNLRITKITFIHSLLELICCNKNYGKEEIIENILVFQEVEENMAKEK